MRTSKTSVLPKKILSRLRHNLVRLRNMQQLTQEGLAYGSGVSKGFLNEVEAGKKSISLSTLEKLLDTLRVDISELFKAPEK